MARIGAGGLSGRSHRRRRSLFMGLLLLALIAPAGWAVAGELTAPYVVLFESAAVSVPDTAADFTSDAVHSFRDLAAPPAMRAATAATSPAARNGGKTRVDRGRVDAHVRATAGRNRVRVNAVYANAVGGFAASLTARQVAAIGANPSVAAVIPDLAVSIDDGSVGGKQSIVRNVADPSWRVPAGVRRVGARTSAITALEQRAGVDADVAILDTGVERDHPDLNVVGGYNCTGRNRNAWDDDDGHGTHVAGIVGALDNRFGVVGVAPGVRLWSVKVLDGNGRGFISSLVCGIDWVTAQRDPRRAGRPLIEVANMSISFGGGHSADGACGDGTDVLFQAICRSVAAGTTYVVAAGNNSHNARRNRPAAYDNVITVSAMADYDGRGGSHGRPSDSCPSSGYERDDSFTDFSNYGPDVDLIAPGRCVLSTYPGKRYAFMSGTSMAAPHVTGAAALYRVLYPRASPSQVGLALQAAGTLDWRTSTDPDHDPERALWVGDFRRPPDFAFAATAASVVAPGSTLQVDIRLTRVGGFDRAVRVSLADPAAGLSAADVQIVGQSATMRIEIAPRTRAATYELTLVARGMGLEHRLSLEVSVRRRGSASGTGDATPPRAPSVMLAVAAPTVGVRGLAVAGASIDESGTLWLSGAANGSVELAVASRDPESGVVAYFATIEAAGWHAEWLGDPSEGRLRVSHYDGAAAAELLISAINGAGLESMATRGLLALDSTPPAPLAWITPLGTSSTRGATATATLSWSGGGDDASGAADLVLARRYRAPLDSRGRFRINAFAADGPYRLLGNGTVETGLAPGYCYVWAARPLDNVGNAGAAAVSGYLVVRA